MIHTEQRVAILADLQNLYYGGRVHHGRVNFKNMVQDIVSGRKLIRALGYGITTTEGMEEKFFTHLEEIGFELRTKELQIFSDGSRKGDWDVGIAMDAIKLSKSVDVVALVSGDGDFIPMIEYIKNTQGVRVELVGFGDSVSGKLLEFVDDFKDLSRNKRRYLIRERKNTRR
jgi:uncharacterized LabA/DUF88 family protein